MILNYYLQIKSKNKLMKYNLLKLPEHFILYINYVLYLYVYINNKLKIILKVLQDFFYFNYLGIIKLIYENC